PAWHARRPGPVLALVPLSGNGPPAGGGPGGDVARPHPDTAECPWTAPPVAGTRRRVARTGGARACDAWFYRAGAARGPAGPGRNGGAQTGGRQRGTCRAGGPDRGTPIDRS